MAIIYFQAQIGTEVVYLLLVVEFTISLTGATNRPSDLDEAIMRRMPLKFYIGLPETRQRLSILKIILEGENVDDDINLDAIAQVTDRFSGSDLKVRALLGSRIKGNMRVFTFNTF